MAATKKKTAPAGITFTSEVIRHVNKQQIGAVSNQAVAEAISTPVYSEGGLSGCYIVGAQISPQGDNYKGMTAQDMLFCCQLQSGDRTASPGILDPDEVGFIGQYIHYQDLASYGLHQTEWPRPISISLPVPIVVLPEITIVYKYHSDLAEFDYTYWFCEIFYRTVRLRPEAYTGLLLSQQRTS